jgi:phage baseplate assembly protein W
MRPDFGCGIHDLVFESLNATTIGIIVHTVSEALLTYEPRIEVSEIVVAEERIREGVLELGINYLIRETNRPDNVVFPFRLGSLR